MSLVILTIFKFMQSELFSPLWRAYKSGDARMKKGGFWYELSSALSTIKNSITQSSYDLKKKEEEIRRRELKYVEV